jgi:hypothetical protein
MNILSWQKINKVKYEYVKDETFCLQFMLQKNSLRGFYIRSGEFDKGLFVGKDKIEFTEFSNYSLNLLEQCVKNN